ncbi:hypothetical protein WICPIJ_004182 [Wickerhamomyces pijperi]|uniref:Uncharacterized protein n=1 Tax=Wickerhamomyces pijperi TaxID=599730 RepID=A0A9P8TN54_WICPI|nr:hypothetical protein WICPIJ_004182 [Wickerhamomyces pijperi]
MLVAFEDHGEIVPGLGTILTTYVSSWCSEAPSVVVILINFWVNSSSLSNGVSYLRRMSKSLNSSESSGN